MPGVYFIVLTGCSQVPSELARPNRVALAKDGLVYVSDFHHDRIAVFDADGAFVRTFGSQGIEEDQLWRVTAMTAADDGSVVVANRRPESDAVGSPQRFELKRFVDGREVSRTMLDGRTLQTDGWVDSVVPSPTNDPTWVVADTTHGELVEVNVDGRRIGVYGGVWRPDAAPSAMVRDGESLWVVEQNRHRITRMLPTGEMRTLELRDAGHRPPRFPSAMGVCSREGWLAIADFGNHRLQRYDLDGNWLAEFAPEPVGIDQPMQMMDLALSPDCSRLYLVDSKGNRVLVTTPDGEVLQTLDRW